MNLNDTLQSLLTKFAPQQPTLLERWESIKPPHNIHSFLEELTPMEKRQLWATLDVPARKSLWLSLSKQGRVDLFGILKAEGRLFLWSILGHEGHMVLWNILVDQSRSELLEENRINFAVFFEDLTDTQKIQILNDINRLK